MAKSVDLTTLSGWASLSTGTHSVTIVAKADGYRDSEPSAGVTVTKAFVPPTDCITFTGETGDFTLRANKVWDGTVEYCTDVTPWTTWDGTEISSHNKKLYLRGSGNTTFSTDYGLFVLSAKAGCSGNLNTLLDYSNPPTTLSANCFNCMFYQCTNLTTAPELPATTLTTYCYQSMFSGCTSLKTAPPILPATTLKTYCYSNMFSGCTSLTNAPELPATTLATRCYDCMFINCTSLKVSSIKTGAYQHEWRIPTSGTISSTPSYWNALMLENTGGTFKSNPSINTTYYGAWTK